MSATPPPLISPSTVQGQFQGMIEEAMDRSNMNGVVIARMDGLVIAHNMPDTTRAKQLGAMAAAVVGVASLASTNLVQGVFREVSIDAKRARIACTPAGAQALAAALLPENADVGRVLERLHHLAGRVARLIEDAEATERGR